MLPKSPRASAANKDSGHTGKPAPQVPLRSPESLLLPPPVSPFPSSWPAAFKVQLDHQLHKQHEKFSNALSRQKHLSLGLKSLTLHWFQVIIHFKLQRHLLQAFQFTSPDSKPHAPWTLVCCVLDERGPGPKTRLVLRI